MDGIENNHEGRDGIEYSNGCLYGIDGIQYRHGEREGIENMQGGRACIE